MCLKCVGPALLMTSTKPDASVLFSTSTHEASVGHFLDPKPGDSTEHLPFTLRLSGET